jgi:hypothetical protein
MSREKKTLPVSNEGEGEWEEGVFYCRRLQKSQLEEKGAGKEV